MNNKYNLPESWNTDIADSNKEVTLTLDRLQLRCLMDQIQNGCRNELIDPIWKATYKAISSAYWAGLEVK